MTRQEIVDAAFRVWGLRFYRNTSLSALALSLGVTKPALYRHFAGKSALLDAMQDAYFDRFSEFIRPAYETLRFLSDDLSDCERCVLIARTIGEYYARRPLDIIYAISRVYSRPDVQERVGLELAKRDMPLDERVLQGGWAAWSWEQPFSASPASMVVMGLFIDVMHFHKSRCLARLGPGAPLSACTAVFADSPGEEEVRALLTQIEAEIRRGLRLRRGGGGEVLSLEYERLDREAALCAPRREESDKLLEAVAETFSSAEAEAASMTEVARKSGLSKSSLYSHFSGKLEMFHRFFAAEYARVFECVKRAALKGRNSCERLYLAIRAIGAYLEANPEIRAAFEWLRIRHPVFSSTVNGDDAETRFALENAGPPFHITPGSVFSPVTDDAGRAIVDECTGDKILFLILHTMMGAKGGLKPENSGECFRAIFRFAAFGLEGEER